MYVGIYVDKKWAVLGLTTGKSPVSVIYCSLVEFNGQKGAYYDTQFVQGKKFGTILLAGQKKGSRKLYYSKPCFAIVYMQYSQYAMLTNAEHQHTTTVQTCNITTGTVCTDSAQSAQGMCSLEQFMNGFGTC